MSVREAERALSGVLLSGAFRRPLTVLFFQDADLLRQMAQTDRRVASAIGRRPAGLRRHAVRHRAAAGADARRDLLPAARLASGGAAVEAAGAAPVAEGRVRAGIRDDLPAGRVPARHGAERAYPGGDPCGRPDPGRAELRYPDRGADGRAGVRAGGRQHRHVHRRHHRGAGPVRRLAGAGAGLADLCRQQRAGNQRARARPGRQPHQPASRLGHLRPAGRRQPVRTGRARCWRCRAPPSSPC